MRTDEDSQLPRTTSSSPAQFAPLPLEIPRARQNPVQPDVALMARVLEDRTAGAPERHHDRVRRGVYGRVRDGVLVGDGVGIEYLVIAISSLLASRAAQTHVP